MLKRYLKRNRNTTLIRVTYVGVSAKLLIDAAPFNAMTTDIYLSLSRFDWLEEYYPWSAEAQDTFTTIQNVTGCLAKHNYDSNYDIEDVS